MILNFGVIFARDLLLEKVLHRTALTLASFNVKSVWL